MMNCSEESRKVQMRARISWIAFKREDSWRRGKHNLKSYRDYRLNQNRVGHVNIMIVQNFSH